MNFTEFGGNGMHGDGSGHPNFNSPREELLEYVRDLYGAFPEDFPNVTHRVLHEGPIKNSRTDEEIGYQKQVELTLSRNGKKIVSRLLIHTPPGPGPFPAFVGLNMYGNESVTPHDHVLPSNVYVRALRRLREKFDPSKRGQKEHHFHMGKLVENGFAGVTAYNGDFARDFYNGFKGDLYDLYPELQGRDDHLAAIIAWEIGIIIMMNYLTHEPLVDETQVVSVGFSRTGKPLFPLLLRDSRFLGAIAEASGTAGGAPINHPEGEPIEILTAQYPHWLPKSIHRARKRKGIDQHVLLAAITRPFLIIAGADDWWTNQRGTRDAVKFANEIREKNGLPLHLFRLRKGGHQPSSDAWDAVYIPFAKSLLN